MTDTIATLFEREGATVVRAPALAEAVVDATAEIKAWVETLVEDRYDIVVFLTGVGVDPRCSTRSSGSATSTRCAPRSAAPPSSRAARSRRRRSAGGGIGVDACRCPSRGRRRRCIDAVRGLPLAGKRVALVHFGERSSAARRGHPGSAAPSLDELCIYEWRLPDDLGAARRAGRARPSTAASTPSSSPARCRCATSSRSRRAPSATAPLIEALNAWTVTASIGPTCSAALVARGITPRIEPTRPKLGPLVERVVQYLAVEGNAR